MDKDKYVKILYKTEPIGERKIVLELTTFDFEAFKRDNDIKEKKVYEEITIPEYFESLSYIEDRVNAKVDKFYKEELEKIRQIQNTKSANKIIKENVINSKNIVCDTIQGNVINCENVQCKNIIGKMINCN